MFFFPCSDYNLNKTRRVARNLQWVRGGAVPKVMAKKEQKEGLHLELKRFFYPNSGEDQK